MSCKYETKWCRSHVHCQTCSHYEIGNITTEPKRDDGIYMQLFAIKDGIRYDDKVFNMKDVSVILTNSLMDGIEKLCK